MKNPVSSIISVQLVRAENIIEQGVIAYRAAGGALREIRDNGLYKDNYPTFEQYCKERWGWERSYAYRLIDAAQVVDNLSTTGSIPSNEGQARELVKLDSPDLQRAAYGVAETIAEQNKAGKVTAKDVKKAVDLVHEVIKEYPGIEPEEIAAKAIEKGAVKEVVPAPPSETDMLRDQLAEMAKQQEEMLAELQTLSAVVESDDKLAEALKQVRQYKEAARIAQERLNGIMNEKNELVRMVKSLQAKIKKAGI